MESTTLLSWIVFLPTIGALLCLIVPKPTIKWVAMGAAALTFAVSLLQNNAAEMFFTEIG